MGTETNDHAAYLLRLADDDLVHGHRLSEWCGHGPTLEEDLALGNVALDLIGQARALYTHAGKIEGKGRDEDQLAYLRDAHQFTNLLMVEKEKGDFAFTVLRLFFFAAYTKPLYERLSASTDPELAGIAAKAVKEASYHLRHAAEWVIRLGDGTGESHRRMEEALDELWPYTAEMFETDAVTDAMIARGIAVDPATFRDEWRATVRDVFAEATLDMPEEEWGHTGGRIGRHTEYLGHMLAEMQFLQRAYPGNAW